MGRHPGSDVDRFIGHRIKQLRKVDSLTQQQVAEKLGISHQQVHKFETAVQRISAGQLFALAGALNATVTDLLDGYGSTPTCPPVDAETERMLLDLERSFLALEPKHQEALVHLTQELAIADRPERSARSGNRTGGENEHRHPVRKHSR